MRVLLDENLPLDFGELLVGLEVSHLEQTGRKGIQNGALLRYAREQYDAFVTLDRGILYQHNHAGHKLIIVVLRAPNSKVETILAQAPKVLKALTSANAADHREV